MHSASTTGIENILFKNGLITSDQLSLIKLESVNTGKNVEDIILAHRLVSDEQLAQARATLLGVPFIKLDNRKIFPEVLNYISEPIARRYILIPFEKKDRDLSVAMADPLDLQIIEFLEKKTNLIIRPYLAVPADINRSIEDQYAQSLSTEVGAALRETAPQAIDKKAEATKSKEEIIREATGASKIVSTLLENGIKMRASDVHIEPQEENTRVRFRIDGILHEKATLSKGVHEAVVSRIKILSDLKIDEKRIPQDGRFNFKFSEEEIDLRVSTLPTVNGEKIVMRLLKKSGGVPSLSDLG